MTDEKFPRAEPDDPDGVVLALKTAGSLWTGGERTEAIRWLRKAQEAADEAGNDERSLALARAAADLTEAAESLETGHADREQPEAKPQLTKPPMPPPGPKARLETGGATPINGSSNGAVAPTSNAKGYIEAGEEALSGPVLTQALRVCIKRSVRDDKLLVARLLEDDEIPAGYQEALVVLTDPNQDVLDKLS